MITAIGVISATAGLWAVEKDLNLFCRLASRVNGYVYLLPIPLAVADIYSTLVSLSLNSQTTELNPFVASAIQYGPVAMVPFLVSYLALSQGIALFMITTGKRLFGNSSSVKWLPFATVCGVSSFGPFSNISGVVLGFGSMLSYASGAISSVALSALVFRSLMGISE